jgi:two-component sensor histidine kinase
MTMEGTRPPARFGTPGLEQAAFGMRGRDLNQHVAAELRAMTILREAASACVRADLSSDECFHRIVDAAIALTGAQKANLQLLDRESGALKIVAQRGFESPFLSFFKEVRDDASACATAMRSGQQIVVEDVTTSEIFAGQASQKVMIEAAARAVVSTPLVSSKGTVLGMISSHFGAPHRPDERELDSMILLARQSADYLERKQAEEVEQILLRELHHRRNNLLTVVYSIVHGSFAKSHSLEEAKTGVESRLRALVRANQQLAKSNWTGLDVSSIVRLELEPFIEQTTLEGTHVILPARGAQDLSLAVHELVTNAVKYGALSVAEGKVTVSWAVKKQDGDHEVLRFTWRESDGPPVVAPTQHGFGSSLLKAICSGTRIDFAKRGVACELEMSLGQRKVADDASSTARSHAG